jgi:hypothetical protein
MSDQASILRAVQALADAQAKSDDTGMCSVSDAHVEILRTTGDARRCEVELMFDYVIHNYAQSGSDWADHYVYSGTATLVDGVVTNSKVSLCESESISESAEPTYDRTRLIATVRDKLRAR